MLHQASVLRAICCCNIAFVSRGKQPKVSGAAPALPCLAAPGKLLAPGVRPTIARNIGET